MSNAGLILLGLFLVFLNAFFVAAEFGMVKLRSTKIQTIKENYGLRGRILEQIHQHLDAYLSACQLGITLASLGLGWVGEPISAWLMRPMLSAAGVDSAQLVTVIAFITVFSVISFLHIVVGELMPKSLAIRQSEAVSIWTAIPLYCFYWLMYPGIWLLNGCAIFLLKIVGLNQTHEGENFYSTDEIKLILGASHLHGELTAEETEIIEHTLEFKDLQVTEVMRPKDEMVSLDLRQPVSELLEIIIQHRYSRYPVYDADQKEMIGLVHAKDLFAALYQDKQITSIEPYLRPVLKVSHKLMALDLLNKFRSGITHFALVYKGKENLLGFITLDNLLHILFGRIKDEFHKTQDDWIENPDGTLTVKGECSIYLLERALDEDITLTEDEEDLDTLAGLLIVRAGTLPKQGETVSFAEFDAVIQELQGSQIKKVIIYPKSENRKNSE